MFSGYPPRLTAQEETPPARAVWGRLGYRNDGATRSLTVWKGRGGGNTGQQGLSCDIFVLLPR